MKLIFIEDIFMIKVESFALHVHFSCVGLKVRQHRSMGDEGFSFIAQ